MNVLVILACALGAAILNHIFSSVFDGLWTSLVAGRPENMVNKYGKDFDLKTLYDDCVNEANLWPSPMVTGIAVTGLVVGGCLAWVGYRKRNRQGQQIVEPDEELDMDTTEKEENEECKMEKSEDNMENSELANILQLYEKLLMEKQQLEAELRRASSQGNKMERLLEATKDEVMILENNAVAMESEYEQRLHEKGDENAKLREDLQRSLDHESKTNLLLKEAKDQNEALQHRLAEKDELIKQKEEEIVRKEREFLNEVVQKEEKFNLYMENAKRKMEEKEKQLNLYMENAKREMEAKERILVQKGKELDQKHSKLQQMQKGIKNEEKKDRKVEQGKLSRQPESKTREKDLLEFDTELKSREAAVLEREKDLLKFDEELRAKQEAVMKFEKTLINFDEELLAKEAAVMEKQNNLSEIDARFKEREEGILEGEKNLINLEKELQAKEESVRHQESILVEEKLKLKEIQEDLEKQKRRNVLENELRQITEEEEGPESEKAEERPALNEWVPGEGETEVRETFEKHSEEDKPVPAGEDDDGTAALSIANPFNLLSEVEDVEEECLKEEKKCKSQRNRRRRKKHQRQEEHLDEENVLVLEAGGDNEIEAIPVQSGAAVEEPSYGIHQEEEDKLVPVEEDKEMFELSIDNPFNLLSEVEDVEEECLKEEKKGKPRRNRRRGKRQERQEDLEEGNITVLEADDENEFEVQPETGIVPVKSKPELSPEEFEETGGDNEKSIIEDSVETEDNKELDENSKKLDEHSEKLGEDSEEAKYLEESDNKQSSGDGATAKEEEPENDEESAEDDEQEDEEEQGGEKPEQNEDPIAEEQEEGESEKNKGSDDEEQDEGESEDEESDDDEESRDYRPKAQNQNQQFAWRVPGLPRKRIPGRQKQRPQNPQPKKCRKKTKEEKSQMKQTRAQFRQTSVKNQYQRGKRI
ncbi:glutamic acid-rich protein-like [Macrobrachium rosenbergii]|uniref:glutamic acid-rich protein-like n=1 Tax=Macrobrachium rosenbergii TaxID=79674 RepID=UPI0034D70462